MMRGARSRQVVGTLLAAFAAATASAAVADARPWSTSYDWQGQAATGYENWTVNEQPAPGGPGPWYQASLGGASQGRGLVIQPTGGRLYDNGDPSSQLGGPATILRWTVPGASTVTRGEFSTLKYRNEGDGQYFRVRIYGGPGSNVTKDFGPAYGQSSSTTTYSLPSTTLTPPGGGNTVEAWLFTVCRPSSSGSYVCPTIASDTGTFGRVGQVTLTLDDPDNPTVDVSSTPQIDDGWVNKRRAQKLAVAASDSSSGIQRIRVQLRLGTSTRTLSDTTVTCDPRHRTADRGGLVCPPTATSSAIDRATDSSTKDRTYIVTAWDYAGNQTTKTLVIRRDVTKPSSGAIGGQLNEISRKWTNRSDTIPVTVRARDSHSGVASATLIAQRVGSGRTIDLGTTAPSCDSSCKATISTVPADLSKLDRDGRYRLKLRVADRAGNQRSFTVGPELKIDRTAPRTIGPAPTYTVRKNGEVRVVFTPSRDPQPGSGRIRLYMVRYYPTPDSPASSRATSSLPVTASELERATPRFARVRISATLPATAKESRYRRSRSRSITFRPGKHGIDTTRPVALIELDDTTGKFAPAEQVDGEPSVPRERQAKPRVAVALAPALLVGAPEVAVVAGVVIGSAFLADRAAKALRSGITKVSEKKTVVECIGQCDTAADKTISAFRRVRTARTQVKRFDRAPTSATLQNRARGSLGQARSAVKAALAAALVDNYTEVPGAQALVEELTRLYKALALQRTQVITAAKTATATARKRRTLKDCDKPGATFLSLTNANKRWNLCVLSKRKPGKAGIPKDAEAHHVFPQKWRFRFAQAGIGNVNEPQLLCWMGRKHHRRWAGRYNNTWERWLTGMAAFHSDNQLHPSDRQAVLRQGRKLASQPKFSCKTYF